MNFNAAADVSKNYGDGGDRSRRRKMRNKDKPLFLSTHSRWMKCARGFGQPASQPAIQPSVVDCSRCGQGFIRAAASHKYGWKRRLLIAGEQRTEESSLAGASDERRQREEKPRAIKINVPRQPLSCLFASHTHTLASSLARQLERNSGSALISSFDGLGMRRDFLLLLSPLARSS